VIAVEKCAIVGWGRGKVEAVFGQSGRVESIEDREVEMDNGVMENWR
jgi:hypothetical protein